MRQRRAKLTKGTALVREVLEVDGEPDAFAIGGSLGNDGRLQRAREDGVLKEGLLDSSLVGDVGRVTAGRRGLASDVADGGRREQREGRSSVHGCRVVL